MKDRYEEALERARAGKSLEEIFPELKEGKDERIRRMIDNTLHEAIILEIISETSYREMSAYLEKQKEQQPVEWSEEDEKMVSFWNMYYERKVYDWPNKDVVEHLERFQEWLNNRFKFLRPQPAEWGEEDEIKLASLINYFEGDALDCSTEDMVRWLKSLRPQPHWKPSEEQMGALKSARYMMNQSGDYYDTTAIIDSLITDLQKLL